MPKNQNENTYVSPRKHAQQNLSRTRTLLHMQVDLTACGSQNPFVARSESMQFFCDFMLLRAQNML